MLVLITFLMIFFTVKYRRDKNPTPTNIEGNFALEVFWTVVPTILVMAMFYYGWIGYRDMEAFPEDALVVKATAQMYFWNFEYENGKKSPKLKLPLGRPVRLNLESKDVLHSFYVPAFRIKKDMVPGIETKVGFTPDELGSYDLFCTEYCGVGHSAMLSTVEVLPQEAFLSWLQGEQVAEKGAEPAGAELIEEYGCVGCHSLDGSRLVGPSFKGIFGRKATVATDGQEREIVIDEAYLRRSMLEPNADVVAGYPDIMPSQEGLVTEQEIEDIINYLKTLQ
jgi:cytochrome c oxidase subunit 2